MTNMFIILGRHTGYQYCILAAYKGTAADTAVVAQTVTNNIPTGVR